MRAKRATATDAVAGQTTPSHEQETVAAPQPTSPESSQRMEVLDAIKRIRENLRASQVEQDVSKSVEADVIKILDARTVADHDALVRELVDILGRCVDRVDLSRFCRHQQRVAVWGIEKLVRAGVAVGDDMAGRLLSLIRRTPTDEGEVIAKLFVYAVDTFAHVWPAHPDALPLLAEALRVCDVCKFGKLTIRIRKAEQDCLSHSKSGLTVGRDQEETGTVHPPPVKPSTPLPHPPKPSEEVADYLVDLLEIEHRMTLAKGGESKADAFADRVRGRLQTVFTKNDHAPARAEDTTVAAQTVPVVAAHAPSKVDLTRQDEQIQKLVGLARAILGPLLVSLAGRTYAPGELVAARETVSFVNHLAAISKSPLLYDGKEVTLKCAFQTSGRPMFSLRLLGGSSLKTVYAKMTFPALSAN